MAAPAYDSDEMAKFVNERLQAYMFNGYGHNLLEMDPDTLNSAFTASVMTVVDQDLLTALAESEAIEETLSTNVKVYDVVEETMKAMKEEGDTPPPPPWVKNDVAFQEEMEKRATTKFVENFSKEKKLNPESRAMFVECMSEFGPKSFGMLAQKLGDLQDRKGELNGLIDELHEAFEKNAPRIQSRWGITRPDEIITVGMPEGMPPGFNPRDILQLGKMMVEALKNPEMSKVDLLSLDGAVEFRDKYARGLTEDNKATFGRPVEGALAADPNGRFAPPAGAPPPLDENNPDDPRNANKPKPSQMMTMGMPGLK